MTLLPEVEEALRAAVLRDHRRGPVGAAAGPRRRRRRIPVGLALSAGIAVAVAVAVLAVVSLRPGGQGTAASGSPPPSRALRRLALQYAVFDRRQTAADRGLQAQVLIDSGGLYSSDLLRRESRWEIVPDSARLIARLAPVRRDARSADVYLVAVSATGRTYRHDEPAQLRGDQVALVVRAATMSDGPGEAVRGAVFNGGATLNPIARAGYELNLVPNGTRRVEWIFNRRLTPTARSRPVLVVAAVRDNIARAAAPVGLHVTTVVWFSGAGPGGSGGFESATLSPPRRYPVRCRPSQLRLTVQPASERTEQHTALLSLQNVAATGCELDGYPQIALLNARGVALRFRLRRSGDQMITGANPRPVAVSPFSFAVTAINKNTCVGFTRIVAAAVRVTLPGGGRALSARLLPELPGLDYCGAGDPGHLVDIAPFEATQGAVLNGEQ